MSLTIEVEKKSVSMKNTRKVKAPRDIFNLQEIQEIKNATQEFMLLFCLDNKNNVIKVTLLGKGKGNCVNFEQKELVRTAILANSSKVILAHNHPSGDFNPSKIDLKITDITNKLLDAFDIELADHLIVTEEGYLSMGSEGYIENELYNTYEQVQVNFLKDENEQLIEKNKNLKEENKNLKKEIKELKVKLKDNKEQMNDEEEEIEI